MRSNLAHSASVQSVYRFLAPIVHRLPYPPGVLAESLAGRREAAARWEAWAAGRGGDRPLIWSHAASVGEQQVLEPVLARLLRTRRHLAIVQTHTSPSVLRTAVPAAVCHRDFLPLDEPRAVSRTLNALRPSLLIFGRGDLWPELVLGAFRRRIPIVVVGGAVRPGSLRLRARRWLRDVHATVSWLGAVSAPDADRWAQLGVPRSRIAVTGDPRHHRLIERVARLDAWRAVQAWAGDAPVLVAGSTEPSDDAVVAEAIARLRGTEPCPRTILVPHNPAPGRVAAVRKRLTAVGCDAGLWSGPPAALPAATTVVVTAPGLLADLYLAATVAYVGGGFRRGTLHAVAEPAAVGLPVIVGLRWEGSPDIGPMVAHGAAVPVGDARSLARCVAALIADADERGRVGLVARSVLTEGAAEASARAALDLLAHAGDGRGDDGRSSVITPAGAHRDQSPGTFRPTSMPAPKTSGDTSPEV